MIALDFYKIYTQHFGIKRMSYGGKNSYELVFTF